MCSYIGLVNCFSLFFCKDGGDRLMRRASCCCCIFLSVVIAPPCLKYRRYRLSCLPFVWHCLFIVTHTHTHTQSWTVTVSANDFQISTLIIVILILSCVSKVLEWYFNPAGPRWFKDVSDNHSEFVMSVVIFRDCLVINLYYNNEY